VIFIFERQRVINQSSQPKMLSEDAKLQALDENSAQRISSSKLNVDKLTVSFICNKKDSK